MYEDLLFKYGVNNVSKLLDIKKKKEETCFKNYGVKNPSQNSTIFKKQLLSSYKIVYYNEELFSQGSYELDFLNYCGKNNIIDIISNGPSLEYELNSKKHIYHADFFIEKYNLIIEIKSSYTYNYDLDKNIAKREYSEKLGYKFLFVIDKNYDTLSEYLKKGL
jgi:Uma2 family endonuclease